MNNELALQQTVNDLVRVYEAAASEIRDCFARLEKTKDTLNASFSRQGHEIHLHDGFNHYLHLDADATIGRIRRDAWELIIERLDLRKFLSIQRWKELEGMLAKDELPEITVENVRSVLRGFMNQAPAMLEEAVEEIFNLLRPHHSEYKTNSEEEIGPKVILEYMVDTGWSGNYQVNYRQHPDLTAIENVFMALDGARTDKRNHYSDLSQAINQCTKGNNTFETDYFKGRVHKNGNLHLEFKRLDLLKRLNQIAGGRRLRKGQAA
jgi:hypothetical protein